MKNCIWVIIISALLFSCTTDSTEESSDDSTKLVEGTATFDTSKKPVVYLIPYGLPDTLHDPQLPDPNFWYETKGDRLFFYQYADLNDYKDKIDTDFSLISAGSYDTVIIFLPLPDPPEDTALYNANITILNEVAADNNLWLLLTLLPEEDYYPEVTYLKEGTDRHGEVLAAMNLFDGLSRTWKIGVWYGWDNRTKPSDVTGFYSSLPANLKTKYACWLDEEFSRSMKDLKDLAGNDFLIITEWYQRTNMGVVSALFNWQMVVTGYEGAVDHDEWTTQIPSFIDRMNGEDRMVAIWMFYDIGDGSGEKYHVFFPGEGTVASPSWESL